LVPPGSENIPAGYGPVAAVPAQRADSARQRRAGAGLNYERLYSWRFRNVDQAGRQAVWREIAQYLHERMGMPSRVLDPAAGRGEFITAVPAAERWGVDRVSQGAPASAGVKMIIADVMAAELPDGYFEGVFVSNFLEHLPDQDAVATVLAKLRTAMAPGGRIAIMGPNFKYCARQYFDCADHTLALSHVAVAEHLYAAGLDVTQVSPKFLPYSFRGALPASQLLTRAYLRTPPIWRLLGKQFLVLARRPGD
jgi:Methyltransferase domain